MEYAFATPETMWTRCHHCQPRNERGRASDSATSFLKTGANHLQGDAAYLATLGVHDKCECHHLIQSWSCWCCCGQWSSKKCVPQNHLKIIDKWVSILHSPSSSCYKYNSVPDVDGGRTASLSTTGALRTFPAENQEPWSTHKKELR